MREMHASPILVRRSLTSGVGSDPGGSLGDSSTQMLVFRRGRELGERGVTRSTDTEGSMPSNFVTSLGDRVGDSTTTLAQTEK